MSWENSGKHSALLLSISIPHLAETDRAHLLATRTATEFVASCWCAVCSCSDHARCRRFLPRALNLSCACDAGEAAAEEERRGPRRRDVSRAGFGRGASEAEAGARAAPRRAAARRHRREHHRGIDILCTIYRD